MFLTASFLATVGFKFQLHCISKCMHGLSSRMLLLLHPAFIPSVVKKLLKGEVGGCALNSHGNYIVDQGKSCNCV